MVWYHGMVSWYVRDKLHTQPDISDQSIHLVLTKHYKLITVFYALQNSNTCLNALHLCCGVWLCVLNHRYWDAGYWCFNWAAIYTAAVIFSTTKHGLMLQAMNFTGVYEIFTSVYGNRTLLLTNQITVFVTAIISMGADTREAVRTFKGKKHHFVIQGGARLKHRNHTCTVVSWKRAHYGLSAHPPPALYIRTAPSA